jgi:hypothetical protein
MKKALSILISLSFQISFGQVYVKLYNKTGHNIDNLTFLDKKIGAIKNNDSTSFLKFDSVLICGVAPCIKPLGQIKDIQLNSSPKGYCGNGANCLKKGFLKNDIILSAKYTNGHELWLGQHKKK